MYDLDENDFPSFKEIIERADKYFIEHGFDPGGYQGFIAGCAWIIHQFFPDKILKYKDGEWIEVKEELRLPVHTCDTLSTHIFKFISQSLAEDMYKPRRIKLPNSYAKCMGGRGA
jgi:hypothetical protein